MTFPGLENGILKFHDFSRIFMTVGTYVPVDLHLFFLHTVLAILSENLMERAFVLATEVKCFSHCKDVVFLALLSK